jgi:hypothetical protein
VLGHDGARGGDVVFEGGLDVVDGLLDAALLLCDVVSYLVYLSKSKKAAL